MPDKEAAKLTVLVVEDEWLVRSTIADFLKEAECEVIEASSGEAAVETLSRGDGIDVVFTDIQLGGNVNGWDVGEASREHDPAMAVIYTSGAALKPERAVAGGLFLPKPYQPENVLAACQTLRGAGKVS